MFKSKLMSMSLSLSRAATTKDAVGGTLRTWAVVTTGIPASVQPASSYTMTLYAEQRITVSHMIYSYADLSGVLPNDRFNDGTYNYVVRGVKHQQQSQFNLSRLFEIVAQQEIT